MYSRIIFVFIASYYIITAQSEVLDPALYLIPSPPLYNNKEDLRVYKNMPNNDEQALSHNIQDSPVPDNVEREERSFRQHHSFNYRSLQIPLTFSITGNYGGYQGQGTAASSGIIGTTYATTSLISPVYAAIMGDNGRSGLAGSGYSSQNPEYYGIRLYGNDGKQAWSGWGNGKWGHYGSG